MINNNRLSYPISRYWLHLQIVRLPYSLLRPKMYPFINRRFFPASDNIYWIENLCLAAKQIKYWISFPEDIITIHQTSNRDKLKNVTQFFAILFIEYLNNSTKIILIWLCKTSNALRLFMWHKTISFISLSTFQLIN